MTLIDAATNTPSSSQAACDAPAKSVIAMLMANVAAMACENRLGGGANGTAASRVGSAITWLKNASNGLWRGTSALHHNTANFNGFQYGIGNQHTGPADCDTDIL